jgi:hypothetical protein
MRRPAVSFGIKLKKGTDHSVPNRKILILGRCRVVDRAVCPLFQQAPNPPLARGAHLACRVDASSFRAATVKERCPKRRFFRSLIRGATSRRPS